LVGGDVVLVIELCAAFREMVVEKHAEALEEEGYGDALPADLHERRRIFRKAVRCALVAHGILHFTKRRVSLPRRSLRAAGNM